MMPLTQHRGSEIPHQTHCFLLSLPPELRRHIYAQCFTLTMFCLTRQGKYGDDWNWNPPHNTALIQTCRQIRAEASPVLYDCGLFIIMVPRMFHFKVLEFDGIRELSLSIEVLAKVGYDFKNPGQWVFNRPFDQVRHLTVEIAIETSGTACSKTVLDNHVGSSHADAIKLMTETARSLVQLSVNFRVRDLLWGSRHVFNMEDPHQLSTWQCRGDQFLIFCEYLHNFLCDWGLSPVQIKAFFAASNIRARKLDPQAKKKLLESDEQHIDEALKEFGKLARELKWDLDWDTLQTRVDSETNDGHGVGISARHDH